jgi:S-adenosylmethionine-diacylglycerol 3-amino-3-carboxypropyl transferase
MPPEASSLERLLYAQAWEDQAVLRGALRLGDGDTAFSITSAGDNSLALLLDDPASVVAVDRNSTQTQLMHLKMAAIRSLAREETLELLGERESGRREELLGRVQDALPPERRAFWDHEERRAWLRSGLVAAGKFERYLALFRRRVLPFIHGRRTVRRLLEARDLVTQRRVYDRSWDTWRWRAVFRIFFGRRVMRRLGRDPSFFAHVQVTDVGEAFRRRAEWALRELPIGENPYVQWILSGGRPGEHLLPPYLRPEGYAVVRERLDRVSVVEEDLVAHLRAAAPGTYDAFNLSDVFEYMSPEETLDALRVIARAGRPGARLCYWNLLCQRSRPDELADIIEPEEELAAELHKRDRAFFYQRLVVERVR